MNWNQLNLDVTSKWVRNFEDAAFVPSYGGDAGSMLAMAFFPNNEDLNILYVYQLAFKLRNANYMKNIFLHELGHALGLRHGFAPEKEGDTVQIGPRQKGSVMDYEFPPTIRKSDVESTRLFYNLTGGQFKGWPIVDWEPNN